MSGIDADKVTVIRGDVVMIDSAPYIVAKAEFNGSNNYTALVSLVDGNFWSKPLQSGYCTPIPLSDFHPYAEKIGTIKSFNGSADIR